MASLPSVDVPSVRVAVGDLARVVASALSGFSVAVESDRDRVVRVARATEIPAALKGHQLVCGAAGVELSFVGPSTMETLLAAAGFGRAVSVASGVYLLCGIEREPQDDHVPIR